MLREKSLIVILGPTAIGKTAVSIALARHYGSEILSADSRQFYREMRIGTAVPSEGELKAVPHHFIHHKSIFDTYTVGDFEREATALLEKKFKSRDVMFLTGGSGLFIKAVTDGLDDFPDIDPTIRVALNEQLEREGLEPLREKLKQADPDYYETADTDNPHRVIRALEICTGTGQPFSSFLTRKKATRPFQTIKICLQPDREVLYDHINRRVDTMMEKGLLEEAKALYEHRELNAVQTVGYRELFRHLDGEWSLETAVDAIKKNTRRYAKRQLTWLRQDDGIFWLDHKTPVGQIVRYLAPRL